MMLGESLYQELILEHYRKPLGEGLREPFDAEVHHVNPTCGDEITLRVTLDGEKITDISYQSQGCSISKAAASVLYDLANQTTVADAFDLLAEYQAMLTGRGQAEPDEGRLGDAVAFVGVAKYPARVKCALLAWMAFKDAAARAMESSEEQLS